MGESPHESSRGGGRCEPGRVPRGCAAIGLSPPVPDRFDAQLARIVEGEILPRLMLTHRGPAPPIRRRIERVPTPDDVDRFCAMLLGHDSDSGGPTHFGYVQALLDEGLSVESVIADLLAPAARRLGTLWEEDVCDFVDVTVGIGRLQAIQRDLVARFDEPDDPEPACPAAGRSILLLPCPGETHLFGLGMVARRFRAAGWRVTAPGGPSRDLEPDACALVAAERFDVVGLSLSCEVLLPALTQAVGALRRASRNPAIRVIVGGAQFARAPESARLVGADACAGDGRDAPALAAALLDTHARVC